jgi:hypothetical protein
MVEVNNLFSTVHGTECAGLELPGGATAYAADLCGDLTPPLHFFVRKGEFLLAPCCVLYWPRFRFSAYQALPSMCDKIFGKKEDNFHFPIRARYAS